MTQTLPILYSFRRCPYAMRARLAIASSQISVELREIVLRDKAHEFLKASPKGTVPVLVTPDQTIEESIDVMHWALAQNDPEGWLDSPDLKLITQADGPFKTALDRTKYHVRYEDADPELERQKANVFLSKLNDRLANQPYLGGSKPNLTDMAIAPFIRQFANIDRDKFNAEPHPNLIIWLDQFLASDRFTSIMSKYKRWQPDDQIIIFPQIPIGTGHSCKA